METARTLLTIYSTPISMQSLITGKYTYTQPTRYPKCDYLFPPITLIMISYFYLYK